MTQITNSRCIRQHLKGISNISSIYKHEDTCAELRNLKYNKMITFNSYTKVEDVLSKPQLLYNNLKIYEVSLLEAIDIIQLNIE